MRYFFLSLLFLGIQNLSAQEASVGIDQLAEELEKTQRLLEIYHVNAYAYRDSVEVNQFRANLLERAPDSMTQVEAYRRLNQFVCFFNDGHTRLYTNHLADYRAADGRFMPIQVRIDQEDIFISSANDNSLIGQQILTVNGQPSASLLAEMESHASRENQYLDRALIARNFPYFLWLAKGRSDTFHLTTDQGAIQIEGVRYEDIPQPANTETEEKSVVHYEILEGRIAYLRIADFQSMSRADFRRACADAFVFFDDQNAREHLILDIRNHDGGDSRYGEDLARHFADEHFRSFNYSMWRATPQFKDVFKQVYIPGPIRWATGLFKGLNPHTRAIYNTPDYENARVDYPLVKPFQARKQFKGQVHLLIDEHTFSAGTSFAAMFQDYKMGTIYGRPSGNLASFYADAMLRSKMPHSGATLHISTSYNVRPSGDERAHSVMPDVEVQGDILGSVLKTLLQEGNKRLDMAADSIN